jgi:hypothetical protein
MRSRLIRKRSLVRVQDRPLGSCPRDLHEAPASAGVSLLGTLTATLRGPQLVLNSVGERFTRVLSRARISLVPQRTSAPQCALQKRLLRQPGGFEGSVPVAVVDEVSAEAISEARHGGVGQLGLDSAPLPGGADGAQPSTRSPRSRTSGQSISTAWKCLLRSVCQPATASGRTNLPCSSASRCSHTISGSMSRSWPGMSWRLNASMPSKNRSTFSCDIAYSDSPRVSRASA